MKKFIIIMFVTLMSTIELQAQVDKEVEVTRAYIPVISKATKPMLRGEINDTDYINPEVDYSITPLSINTPLQTLPIKPATVTYWEFNRPATAQIKIGAGYPLNSLFQGYISTHNASVGYLAANIDHVGDYSKIENIYSQKVNATQTLNSAAIAGGLYIGNRTLGGEVSYSYDLYNKYAFEQSESPLVSYQEAGASLFFSDNFVDLSKLNFALYADYLHLSDRSSNSDDEIDFGATFAKDLTLGEMCLSADYKFINSNYGYENQTLGLDLSLSRKISSWQMLLGAKYYYDNSSLLGVSSPHHYIIPRIIFKRATSSSFSPFLEMGGSIYQNSYANLVKINPYIDQTLSASSSVEYDLVAGVAGDLNSSKFSYQADVTYSVDINSRYWALWIVGEDMSTVENNYFDMQLADLNTISFNLALDYRPRAALRFALDGSYHLYNECESSIYVNSKPRYQAEFSAEYKMKRFGVALSAELIGEREFTTVALSEHSEEFSVVELPAAVDLSVNLNWRAKDNLSIFVEGSNLCNSQLNPWLYYHGFGLRLTAGVKINFR